jgi:dTDP-4-dehydrorhamnose reductase
MAVNGIGPENMARACSEREIPFVTFSSDQVFDGVKGGLYVEGDRTNPLNIYGTSKAEAERRVLALGSQALIVRTAAFFSPYDPHNFAVALMQALRAGREFPAARDQFVSPTYVPDLVDAVLDLLIDGETGIWHLTNAGRVSWAQFAALVAQRARLDRKSIRRVPGAALGMRAPRPADVALHSGRGQVLPPLEHAISRFVDGCWNSPHFRGDGTEFNALMS